MESDWDEDLDKVDYRARPTNDQRKSRPLVRNRLTLRGPPPGWPRDTKQEDKCPQHSPEYMPMVESQQDNNSGEVRSILLPERRKKPQGWPQCFWREHPQNPPCAMTISMLIQ